MVKSSLMEHPIFWTAEQRAAADAEWFAACRRAEAENAADQQGAHELRRREKRAGYDPL